jgi:hypothetical protein
MAIDDYGTTWDISLPPFLAPSIPLCDGFMRFHGIAMMLTICPRIDQCESKNRFNTFCGSSDWSQYVWCNLRAAITKAIWARFSHIQLLSQASEITQFSVTPMKRSEGSPMADGGRWNVNELLATSTSRSRQISPFHNSMEDSWKARESNHGTSLAASLGKEANKTTAWIGFPCETEW